MQNHYRVKGDVAYIGLPGVNGKNPLPYAEVAIDRKNLERAAAFPGTWYQSVHQNTGEIYVRGAHRIDGKRSQPVLARWIAQPGPRQVTKHLDEDGLNCLECNLVNVPVGAKDWQDYKPIGEAPKPEKVPEPPKAPEDLKPVKGVSFHKGKRKWEVKPYYHGKRQNMGYWPEAQLAEANEAAEYVRQFGPEAYKALIKGGN